MIFNIIYIYFIKIIFCNMFQCVFVGFQSLLV